jgi:hypothetical protein
MPQRAIGWAGWGGRKQRGMQLNRLQTRGIEYEKGNILWSGKLAETDAINFEFKCPLTLSTFLDINLVLVTIF